MIAVRHRAALLCAILAATAATLIMPGRASAVEPGFQVEITELPRTFTAGADARQVTVVATSEQNRCVKVRWSLLLEVDGPGLDEVEVARDEDGDFPVQVQNVAAGTARITDVQLDPGLLCRGRTVTARYQIAFDDEAEPGRVTFRAQAFNAGRTLLQETSSRSEVKGEREEPEESESPSPSASPSPSESAEAEEADDEATAEPEPTDTDVDVAAVPTGSNSGTPSLLGAGLIVGGILVFLGVGLLLRLRMRGRAPKHGTELPTGFYPTN
ncbi:hypothetical protein AB0C29_41755 [Actinoplanes sp. NPDC048791]|uniref:hypothetical protein n=1 Tax=Actinoplanes sp. NPDC048791 TaxID=3154623 RepID=UPI0033CF7984